MLKIEDLKTDERNKEDLVNKVGNLPERMTEIERKVALIRHGREWKALDWMEKMVCNEWTFINGAYEFILNGYNGSNYCGFLRLLGRVETDVDGIEKDMQRLEAGEYEK